MPLHKPESNVKRWRWMISLPDSKGRIRVKGWFTATIYGYDCWNQAVHHAFGRAQLPTKGTYSGCNNCKDIGETYQTL